MVQPWTESDTEQLLELLDRLPKRKPLEIFLWFCANLIGSPLEGIFFRTSNGRKEVLLKRRADNPMDVYKGMLDVFGTVMLQSDVITQEDPDWEHPVRCYKRPLARILTEAGLSKFGSEPQIGPSRLFLGDRGPVNQTIVLCTVPDDETPNGEWYPVDVLPKLLIWEHRSLIALATEHMVE